MNLLSGIRILDFSRLLPGPLATNLLAQLGAEVIRVEHPQRSDLARQQPPFRDGVSTLFEGLNFAKSTRLVDYTTPAGRDQVLQWVAEVDCVVEQFRPGVMGEWGLDYAGLQVVNPRLIYCSLTGYGQEGPFAQYAGHDINYLAYSGILSLNTDANGKPVIPGIQLADIAGGSYQVVMALLAALWHRERHGQGSYLDLAMLDGLLPLLTIPASQRQGEWDPYTMNFLSGALVNYNVYACADQRWVALGALELKFWNNFCTLVDRPDWQRNNPMELSVHLFPKAELEALFRSKTQAEWVALAAGHDVCLSPVLTLEEAAANKHLLNRYAARSGTPQTSELFFQPPFGGTLPSRPNLNTNR